MNRPGMSVTTCFLLLLLALGHFTTLTAQEPAPAPDKDNLVLPLVYRSPNQRVLLAIEWPDEAESAMATLRDHKLKFDRIAFLDPKKTDYSQYHLIIGGSNCMDTYASNPEPEAFAPIERFVATGGHLLLFGTFNGRNSAHLERFGIRCGIFHSHTYRDIPGRTEVLFHGMESIVPGDRKMVSTGNFIATVPHVVMLQRGADAGFPEQPAIATLAYKSGRVTFTQVEPGVESAYWIVNVMTNWAAHGAPTVSEQLDKVVVLDDRELAEQRKLPIPPRAEIEAADQELKAKLRDVIETATTPEDKLQIGDQLLAIARSESTDAQNYAALSLARELYQQADNPEKFYRALNELKAAFKDTDLDSIAIGALTSFLKSIRDPVGSASVAKVGLDLTDDLIESQDFEAANQIITLTRDAAQIAKNKQYLAILNFQSRRLPALSQESQHVQPFREILRQDPSNAEASLEVGKFECLALRHWNSGFKLIAKGSDDSFRQLADAELKGTDEPMAQAAIGDLWMSLASKLPAATRPVARSRAKSWYWQAASQLAGAQRTAMEKKAARIATGKSELRISFRSSGPAELVINRDRMSWTQTSGSPPTGVQVNGQYWAVGTQSVLKNLGSTRYFLEEVNLETAALKKEKNQGAVELKSVTPDELVIEMADQLDCELVIKFGP